MKHYSNDPAREYPMLWSKVIYDGSHTGDLLTGNVVRQLSEEVSRLSRINNLSSVDNTLLTELLHKLEDLIEASLSVNKPISF